MAGSDELRDSEVADSAGQPGPLSRLLQELAEAPGDDVLAAWRDELNPGDRLDRFEIRREIGRGGFGAVYEAYDHELGRVVAIKTLRPGRSRRDFSSGWIKKEAEAVAKLSHPGIVTLFDVCNCASGPYLVMELLEGRTLAERLAEGPLPRDEALRVAEEVAQALAHAHQRGVLHRDLKPANVFLCNDGRVKLLDFGLAHLLGTHGTSGAGTPAYMAPEQARDEPVDERADVYAAGMVLGEMITGKRPLAPSTPRAATLAKPDSETELMWPSGPELATPPAPASQPNLPGVPRPVAKVVSSALATDPAARPRDGAAWLESLRAARQSLERPRKARRIAILGSAFLVLGLTIAGLATWRVWRAQLLVGDDGRIAVAVADVVNQTGDPELDGLSGLLVTSLQQSSRLRVLTRTRMLDLLAATGRVGTGRLDEPLAREAGRKAGVRALVLATVRRVEDVYALEVKVLDPVKDDYLFALKEQARGKATVLDLVDRLSERTRTGLHEKELEVRRAEVKVASAVTPNLEAYRQYFLGMQCLEQMSTWVHNTPKCLPHLEKAVALDPDFAMAWIRLGWIRHISFMPGAREAISAAVRLSDRVPPLERVHLRAMAAHADGRDEEAARLYRESVRMDPDDRHRQADAGEFFYAHGYLEEAIPHFRKALDLAPLAEADAATYLIPILGYLGRRAEVAELLAQLREAPRSEPVLESLAWAHLILGDGQAAAREARGRLFPALLVAEGIGPGEDDSFRASPDLPPRWLPLYGRHRELKEILSAFEAKVRAGDAVSSQWRPLIGRFPLAAAVGARDLARDFARRAVAAEPGPDPVYAIELAYRGELDLAEVVAKKLTMGSPHEQAYRAVVSWKQGDRELARRLLEDLCRRSPYLERAPSPLFLRGELLAEMGRDAEAVDALDAYRSNFGLWEVDRQWNYPKALLLLARLHEGLGNRDQALKAVADLLHLWRQADPDLPPLIEAKAMRARLEAAP